MDGTKEPGFSKQRVIAQIANDLHMVSQPELEAMARSLEAVRHGQQQQEQTCDTQPAPRRGAVTLENIDRWATYQQPDTQQREGFQLVKEGIIAAGRAILRACPDSPGRSRALAQLGVVRMEANGAIAHRGEF